MTIEYVLLWLQVVVNCMCATPDQKKTGLSTPKLQARETTIISHSAKRTCIYVIYNPAGGLTTAAAAPNFPSRETMVRSISKP
jgi:hypothetical protein